MARRRALRIAVVAAILRAPVVDVPARCRGGDCSVLIPARITPSSIATPCLPVAGRRPNGGHMNSQSGEITQLLADVKSGRREAEAELMERLYQPLRKLAVTQMRRERADNSLQATALVNEVYLRLVQPGGIAVQGRTHFMAVAATVMRRILVDHARTCRAKKRWGTKNRVHLEESAIVAHSGSEDVLAVHECLQRLAAIDQRQSKIVEMKFFGGLSERDIADVCGISERTVRREWGMARAWLHGELSHAGRPPRRERPPMAQ
jgi:RNA polymerase sigma-70 factor (ECF subfamily)